MIVDVSYLKRKLYSDGCGFLLSGDVNKQNCRIWRAKRPQEVHKVPNGTVQIMVWCTVSSRGMFDIYFFENESATREICKKLLRYLFFPSSKTILKKRYFNRMTPQPISYSCGLNLDQEFVSRWFGKGVVVSWPLRSPDFIQYNLSLRITIIIFCILQ